MCLIINRFRHLRLKPKVAKKDIVCYKILTYHNGVYRTPFQGVIVHPKTQPMFYCSGPFEIYPEIKYTISEGIHTFRRFPQDTYNRYHIFKCIIPKGTKYWFGKYNEYCSERIKFIERVIGKL